MKSIPYDFPNKKLELVMANDGWAEAVRSIVTAATEAEGWEIVLSKPIQYGTTDCGPMLATLRSAKPALTLCVVPSAPGVSSTGPSITTCSRS